MLRIVKGPSCPLTGERRRHHLGSPDQFLRSWYSIHSNASKMGFSCRHRGAVWRPHGAPCSIVGRGELAEAEVARLRRNLGEQQSQLLVQDFDEELSAACTKLVPTGTEFDEFGRDAFTKRQRQVASDKPTTDVQTSGGCHARRCGCDAVLAGPEDIPALRDGVARGVE